jgi:hypothetical protein
MESAMPRYLNVQVMNKADRCRKWFFRRQPELCGLTLVFVILADCYLDTAAPCNDLDQITRAGVQARHVTGRERSDRVRLQGFKLDGALSAFPDQVVRRSWRTAAR